MLSKLPAICFSVIPHRQSSAASQPHQCCALTTSAHSGAKFEKEPLQANAHGEITQVEQLLATDVFQVQNEQQVFEAALALKRGLGEFEDALIGALNAWAGCYEWVTFVRGTSRLPNLRVLG